MTEDVTVFPFIKSINDIQRLKVHSLYIESVNFVAPLEARGISVSKCQ